MDNVFSKNTVCVFFMLPFYHLHTSGTDGRLEELNKLRINAKIKVKVIVPVGLSFPSTFFFSIFLQHPPSNTSPPSHFFFHFSLCPFSLRVSCMFETRRCGTCENILRRRIAKQLFIFVKHIFCKTHFSSKTTSNRTQINFYHCSV